MSWEFEDDAISPSSIETRKGGETYWRCEDSSATLRRRRRRDVVRLRTNYRGEDVFLPSPVARAHALRSSRIWRR
jgi:hypothetical protein